MTAPLVLDRVSAGYGERVALESVSVAFEAGQVTGILGANGSGKTTLLRVVTGLASLFEGTVRVLDVPREQWSREALARTVSYLPQGAEPHWPVEAWRLVALGRLPHLSAFASISGADREAIAGALARCDALAFAMRRIDRLSAGERARVLLARALATQAHILLADEPAAHLDPAHQLKLMELLRNESRRGVAVVVTLHELSLASRFCDRLVVLSDRRVLAAGPPEMALTDDNLARAFGIRPFRNGDDIRLPVIPWQTI